MAYGQWSTVGCEEFEYKTFEVEIDGQEDNRCGDACPDPAPCGGELARTFITALNLLLLLDFLALAYSGTKISGFALSWLHLPGSMQTARILHLSASWWGFILMSMHMGVHSGLHGKVRIRTDDANHGTPFHIWFFRGILCAMSVFGIYAVIDLNLADYLFLRTHFMMFDDFKSLGLYLTEIVCVVVFFTVLGHFLLEFFKFIG